MAARGVKKALKIAARIVGGLVLFCLLLFAGGLIWLRTAAAERYIVSLAIDALTEQGLTLTLEEFSGPLPQHIRARGIQLADAAGPVLTAEKLAVDVNLLALLGGTLHIENISLLKPELFRLPDLPESPESQVKEEPAKEPDSISLPVGIVLDELRLQDGRVASAILQLPEGFPGFLDLDAEAALRLVTGALTGRVTAALAGGGEDILRAEVEAVQDGVRLLGSRLGKDTLHMRIEGRENANGLVSLLLGQPLPAYALRFDGSGPVDDWQASITLDARTAPFPPGANGLSASAQDAGKSDILAATAALSLKCPTASLWDDLIGSPAWDMMIQAEVVPGGHAPQPLPALLGERLIVDAAAGMKGKEVTASAQLTAPAWRVSAERLALTFPRESGLDANGHLRAALADGRLLRALDLLPADSPIDLGQATLEADLSASLRGADMNAKTQGSLNAQLNEESLRLSWRLDARQAGAEQLLVLHEGQLLGINLSGQARRAGADVLEASLKLNAPDNAPWQELLSAFAGLERELIRGSLDMEARISAPGGSAVPTAELTVAMEHLNPPPGPAQKILGSNASLQANLTGLFGPVYTLHIKDLRTEGLHVEGNATYGGPATKDSLEAAFRLSLADLGALEAGITGPVEAELRASGTLNELDTRLHVTSKGLMSPTGAIEPLDGAINAKIGLSPALHAAGDFSLALTHARFGPFESTAGWEFALSQGSGPIALALRNLSGQGLGVDLHGDVRGTVAGQTGDAEEAAPRDIGLDGSLRAEIKSWSAIAGIFSLPVLPGATQAEVTLARTAEGQSAVAALSLESLRDATGTAFEAERIKANLQGTALFTAPAFSLNLATAAGRAGPLEWDTGALVLQGTTEAGTVNAALSSQSATAAPAVQGGSSRAAPPKVEDKLKLAGHYALDKSEFEISELTLREPSINAGLHLQSPVTVKYSDGLEARGIRAGILPAGNLSADIALVPGSASLTADIQSLSFGIFRLFTTAILPQGQLDAKLDYQIENGLPQGSAQAVVKLEQVSGAPATLECALDAELTTGAAPAPNAPGAPAQNRPAHLRGEGVIRMTGANAGPADSSVSSASGEIPAGVFSFSLPLLVGADGLPAPDMKAPLSAGLDWKGAVGPLWQFAQSPGQSLNGAGALNLSATGTLESPEFSGQAHLAGGRFEDTLNGILLTHIDVEANVTQSPEAGSEARLLLSARDANKGSIAIDGSALDLLTEPVLLLRGQIKHLQPLHRDDLSVTLSGLFNITGPLVTPVVAMDILVERGELELISGLGGSIRTLEIGGDQKSVASGKGPMLSIQIEIPRYFFVRGRGLDSEWAGKLTISGPAAAPQLTGSLRPVRGQFELLSKPFAFSGGDIAFTGGRTINPSVNLELTHSGSDILAIVKAGGTLSKLKLSLESRPPLPQDEVLAQVLFGKRMSDLSRFEALQLANGMRELTMSGQGGLNPLVTMRKTLGLDVLRLGGTQDDTERRSSGQSGAENLTGPGNGSSRDDASAAPSIEAGKYINDSIYIGIEQGATQESTAVRVEIELFPSVTLEGSTSSSSSRVGIGWKKDY